MGRFVLVGVSWWWGRISRYNSCVLTDRWLRVLWLAAIRDAGVGPVSPSVSMRACTVVRVICDIGITGSGRLRHLSHPRRAGSENALRER